MQIVTKFDYKAIYRTRLSDIRTEKEIDEKAC